MITQTERDARAWSFYKLSQLLHEHDPILAKYIEDLGKASQANDATCFFRCEREIQHHLNIGAYTESEVC